MKRFKKVYLEITNVCNLACNFCPGTKREKRFMNRDFFNSCLDEIVPFTDYVYFHLMGEPLLHPELIQFVEDAGNKGLKVCLTTNGSLLTEREENLFSVAPFIHKISISLQAEEANVSLRVQKEEYLKNCFSFAKKAEGKFIVSFRLWNRGGAEEDNVFILNEIKKYFNAPWEENPMGYKIGDRVYLEFGDKFNWPDLSLKNSNASTGEPEPEFCMALRDQIGVLVDGTVVPCCLDHDGDIALGNLNKEHLDSIIKSPRATRIINNFSARKCSENLCKTCGFATRFNSLISN